MIYTYSELKNNGLDNYNINKKVASQILVCLIFFAIISVGRDNLHNFPEYRYNREIKKNNIKLYRTDENNTIWLTSDGTKIEMNPLKYNLDRMGRKQEIFFERKYFLLSFLVL